MRERSLSPLPIENDIQSLLSPAHDLSDDSAPIRLSDASVGLYQVTRIERSRDPSIKLRLLELGLGMGALVEVTREGSRLTIRIRRATMIFRQDEVQDVFIRSITPVPKIAHEVAQEVGQ